MIIYTALILIFFVLLGEAGAGIISRIKGLILASLAADSVLTGINNYFGIGI